jgi:hypothetical protein
MTLRTTDVIRGRVWRTHTKRVSAGADTMTVTFKTGMRSIALLLALAATPALAHAQSGEAAVYVDQFRNLQQKMEQIFSEIKSSRNLPGSITHQAVEIQERLLALEKLVNRLGETALSANVQRDHLDKSDKSLLLVNQGCNAIDFVLTALTNYVDTGDRVFLELATDGKLLALTVVKVL